MNITNITFGAQGILKVPANYLFHLAGIVRHVATRVTISEGTYAAGVIDDAIMHLHAMLESPVAEDPEDLEITRNVVTDLLRARAGVYPGNLPKVAQDLNDLADVLMDQAEKILAESTLDVTEAARDEVESSSCDPRQQRRTIGVW